MATSEAQSSAEAPKACEASFPTAALVAYWRGADAKSAQAIGSNIGAGPDLLAEALAGSLGKAFSEELTTPLDASVSTLAGRTMFYDELWMQALDQGCKQFVLLAAGLDARAWRLPRHDASVTIFELDVPRCHRYKEEKLAALPGELTTPSCSRVPVELDLSDPAWTSKLVAAGFDPSAPSFFLAEGLLMYVPPSAVPGFFASVSSMMCPGSTFAACCLIDCIHTSQDQDVFAKYGGTFTFEAKTEKELRALLSTADLETKRIVSSMETLMKVPKPTSSAPENQLGPKASEEEVDEEKAHRQAEKIVQVVSTMASWPKVGIEWAKTTVASDGYQGLAASLIADALNFQDMRDESKAQKARVLELAVDKGFEATATAEMEKLPSGGPEDGYAGYIHLVAVKTPKPCSGS